VARRQRHPKQGLEQLLADAEGRGWRIVRGKGYFMMLCPCGKHRKTVKLSPSNPNYERECGQLRRATCWDQEEGR